MPPEGKVGILAGGGDLPLRVADACVTQSRAVFVVVFEGQGDAAAFEARDVNHATIRLGAAGKAISRLRDEGCETLVMAGTIRRPSLKDLRPDWWAMKFFATSGAASMGDDGLLRALIKALEDEGFDVCGADAFLPSLLMPEGLLGTVSMDSFADDVTFGITAARQLGGEDKGQAVVVRGSKIIAEEGPDGTDAMLARLAENSNVGGVLCKTLKPGQERRADLPTVGRSTVENAARAGLDGIAVDAKNAFMMDLDDTVAAADAHNMFIVGVSTDRP